MSRTVFILGAGASADAGAPLMGNFFDRAERLMHQAGAYRDAFEAVFKGRAELQRVHTKARLDLDNLEAVFAAFEMASLHEQLGDLPGTEVKGLPSAIRLMIARTLELTVLWPVRSGHVEIPGAYGVFAKLIGQFLKKKGEEPDPVSVITFNYDVAVDYALEQILSKRWQLDYALGSREERPKDAWYLDLMKLHGSLNWTRCAESGCEAVQTWRIADCLRERPFPVPDDPRATANLPLELLGDIRSRSCQACKKTHQVPEPMIVPPTWSKTQYYERIRPVWKRAAQHLHEAENIIIVGYSLTPTDESFKYLFALGTMGPTTIRRVWVFDWHGAAPGYQKRLKARYKRLLGLSTEKRLRMVFESFGWAVEEVERDRGSF